MEHLAAHPLFGLYTFLFGLLFSAALSYSFHRFSIRTKQPYWAIKSTNMVQGFSRQLPSLNIRYGDSEVENLTVSKVMFWNAGNQTLDGQDISRVDPLRIEPVGSTKMLDIKLVASSGTANNVLISTKPDMSGAFIDFDFLEHNEGVVVQVVHTGTTSDDLRVLGTFRGSEKLLNRKDAGLFRSPLQFLNENSIMLFLALGCFAIAFKNVFAGGESLWTGIGLFFLGMVLAFDVAHYFYVTVPIPRGLEIFRIS